jgi:ubiquinone/menaquinone biosynthesis C-methylase UbiE
VTSVHTCEWPGYVSADFVFADYPPGARVLDVGFGGGEQMRKLAAAGCRPLGVEYDGALAARAGAMGLKVCQAQAEHLPFASASLDGLLCKVVVPYTDEARAIGEMARVLRPGAVARMSYHGLGYSLSYLFTERSWKRRVYAARVIVNTWIYRLSGRRLPGFMGDSIYQSNSRLRRYYRQAGFELVEDRPATRFAGAPVFLYHTLRKAGA